MQVVATLLESADSGFDNGENISFTTRSSI